MTAACDTLAWWSGHANPQAHRAWCCGWGVRCGRTRRGRAVHFPERLTRDEQLRAYASWCNAVEGNTTFYGAARRHDRRRRGRRGAGRLPVRVQAAAGDHPRAPPARRRRRASRPSWSARAARRPGRAAVDAAARSRSVPPTSTPSPRSSATRSPGRHRFGVEVRHPAFFDARLGAGDVERLLADHGVEWISLDTTTLYATSPPSAAERGAPAQKPRLPRRREPSPTGRSCGSSAATTPPDARRVAAVDARRRPLARRGPHPDRVRPHPRQRRRPGRSPGCSTTTSAPRARPGPAPPTDPCGPVVEEPTLFPDDPADTVTVPDA